MDTLKQSLGDPVMMLRNRRDEVGTPNGTLPGGEPYLNGSMPNGDHKRSRNRPRVFPYFKCLPYQVEDEARRQQDLEEILKHLYIALQAGDFAPGAVHWTRELRSWMSLKFDPTIEQRVKLVKLYYELALAPGIESTVAERFTNMFLLLVKRKHYLRPLVDLTLPWKPLLHELKAVVIPGESGISATTIRRSIKSLQKICSYAQLFFDPADTPEMLEEIMPYFSMSTAEGAFVVIGLINLMIPTAASEVDSEELRPQHFLPTYFHLWSLVNRSRTIDVAFVDLFSRMAKDSLPAKSIAFTEYGVFTSEQTTLIYTAILRLLEIPVGQSTSPYSPLVDVSAGMGVFLDRDSRKHPISNHVARWIVMSLSPACLTSQHSVLSLLESLIQAIETFFHPSNSGAWTRTLAQLVSYLADFFDMR